jgi:hypothetical protein
MSTSETNVVATLRERVCEAVATALGDAYDCLRVWSAWSVGTMGPDDFVPVANDDDRVGEIADAAIAAMPTPSAEQQDLQAKLDDARNQLEELRVALDVSSEPLQSLHERMLERAREADDVGILRAYKRDWEKVIRARDIAAQDWGLRELEGLSGENTVSHLVYLLLNERHSPRRRTLSMRERMRPFGRIRRAL